MKDETLKDECDRALDLAQTIARDIVNRIREEFTEVGSQNAATISIFGYLTGVGDTVRRGGAGITMTEPLFGVGRLLGEMVGASPTNIRVI